MIGTVSPAAALIGFDCFVHMGMLSLPSYSKPFQISGSLKLSFITAARQSEEGGLMRYISAMPL
jgi:hypothetical protein